MCRPLFALLVGLFLLVPEDAILRAQAEPKTVQEKIASALAAAPPAIAADARVEDWPPSDGAEPPVLRHGTGRWACFPDDPSWPGNEAMCVDEAWQRWYRAYWAKAPPPRPRIVGIGYMLTTHTQASNTDPFATAATPENQWHKVRPHIMLLVPNPATLEGLPTEPTAGGPYVMYKGTPYVHVMVPVE